MLRLFGLIVSFCMVCFSYAKEIDYRHCKSIQEAIAKETEEIIGTLPSEHDELVELYISRGESYLLAGEHEKAVKDFENAHSQLGYCQDAEAASFMAFRAAFGAAVSYDNLGMQEQTQEALKELQALVEHVGCSDCIEDHPCQGTISSSANRLHYREMVTFAANTMHFQDLIIACKRDKQRQPQKEDENFRDNYDDISGPTQPPESNWCEEIVVGTGTLMEGIALLAPNWGVKTVLIAALEALKQRALKCCETGEFWKACVAPMVRKWKQWKDNKERGALPNADNLPLYTQGVP